MVMPSASTLIVHIDANAVVFSQVDEELYGLSFSACSVTGMFTGSKVRVSRQRALTQAATPASRIAAPAFSNVFGGIVR